MKNRNMESDQIYEGQTVRIIDWGNNPKNRPIHWNNQGDMDYYKGRIVTIRAVGRGSIRISYKDDKIGWGWSISDFELIELLPDDNPNVVYRVYRQEKRIADLIKKI